VRAEGDHKIHVFNVDSHRLELDPRFDLDFTAISARGPRVRTAWRFSASQAKTLKRPDHGREHSPHVVFADGIVFFLRLFDPWYCLAI